MIILHNTDYTIINRKNVYGQNGKIYMPLE